MVGTWLALKDENKSGDEEAGRNENRQRSWSGKYTTSKQAGKHRLNEY